MPNMELKKTKMPVQDANIRNKNFDEINNFVECKNKVKVIETSCKKVNKLFDNIHTYITFQKMYYSKHNH